MTTRTTADVSITDACPIPTWNPTGDIDLQLSEARRETREGKSDEQETTPTEATP